MLLHHAAAVPYQRAEHVLPGAADRRDAGRRAAVFRVAASGRDRAQRGATVTYVLGAMVPILLSRPPSRRGARSTACASRWRPACRRHFQPTFTQRFGIALLDGYGSTETNFVLGCDGRPASAPGTMGPVCAASRRASSTTTDNDAARRRAGRTGPARRRAVRLRHRLFRHAGEDRRGVAQSAGSTPATASMRDADGYFRFVDRHEGRDPPARREHLLLSRSSRCCCPIPDVGDGGGLSGAVGAGRGRGDGGDRAASRGERSTPRRARAVLRGRACRISPSRASSNFATRCR